MCAGYPPATSEPSGLPPSQMRESQRSTQEATVASSWEVPGSTSSRPSSMCTSRSARAATSASCVTRTTVSPLSARSRSMRSSTVRPASGRGSQSARPRAGSAARWRAARAMATRWRSPPDSCGGRLRFPPFEPDGPKKVSRALTPIASGQAELEHRHLHVLDRRQRRQQVVELEDHPNVTSAVVAELTVRFERAHRRESTLRPARRAQRSDGGGSTCRSRRDRRPLRTPRRRPRGPCRRERRSPSSKVFRSPRTSIASSLIAESLHRREPHGPEGGVEGAGEGDNDAHCKRSDKNGSGIARLQERRDRGDEQDRPARQEPEQHAKDRRDDAERKGSNSTMRTMRDPRQPTARRTPISWSARRRT